MLRDINKPLAFSTPCGEGQVDNVLLQSLKRRSISGSLLCPPAEGKILKQQQLPENIATSVAGRNGFSRLLWSRGGILCKVLYNILSSEEAGWAVCVLDACLLSHVLLCCQQFTTLSICLRYKERKYSLFFSHKCNFMISKLMKRQELFAIPALTTCRAAETPGWVCKKSYDNSLLTIPRAAAFLPQYCFSGFIMLSSFFPFEHFPFSQRSHYQYSPCF